MLASDPCWRALLQVCVSHGSYCGEPLPPDLLDLTAAGEYADGGDALPDMLAALFLDEINVDGIDPSHQMEEGSMEMPSYE